MPKHNIFTILFTLCALIANAQYQVQGGGYSFSPSASTGIETVYIANELKQSSLSYIATSGQSVKWYTYSQSLSDASQITNVQQEVTNGGNTTYSISSLQDGKGYLVEVDGNFKSAVWVIDYSLHQPQIQSITATASDDCSSKSVLLTFDKEDALTYFSTGGTSHSLQMEYRLQYDKQMWNEATKSYATSTYTSDWMTIGKTMYVSAPLMNTKFSLIGTKIAETLGMNQTFSSEVYEETFSEARIIATQSSDSTPDNEVASTTSSELGGSAPATISFVAGNNTQQTLHYNWTIFKKTDLKNWIARYNDAEITYTFTQAGNYVVQLATTSQGSTCSDTATVEVNISESFLDLPNYFTPNASEGVNDEYKVAYRSLVSFKATIFNRWGNKLFQWSDPAKGWDGKYNGKFVPPGVYYIVVEAEGSDGIKYKRGRDINILTTK